MELRLEDLQNEETHVVDATGASIGRDSRRASIVIADPGVSGAHAKITQRGGRFYIQDTNSSNGTFVEGTRLRGELELKDGFVVALHKYKFRVIMDNGGAGDSTALFEPKVIPAGKAKAPARQEKARTMGNAPTRTEAQDVPDDDEVSDDDGNLSEPLPLPRDKNAGRGPGRTRDLGPTDDDEPVDEDVDQGEPEHDSAAAGAAAIQGGFGRALAYYLAAVPKMALMPKASVAEMIELQPIPPMEKVALIAWALPPALLVVFITLLSTVITGVVSRAFGMAMLISALISSAIVVVSFGIAAFFFHPIAAWWVKILKGESDVRSRTNWFVTTYTAMTLGLMVQGIAGLFALLAGIRYIGPFIQIVPLLLGLGATLISLYAAYNWHVHFKVINWFPKLFMLAGVVMIAMTVLGVVNLVRLAASGGGAGANIAAAGGATGADASAEALKAQAELQARADAAIAQQKALQGNGTAPSANTAPTTAPTATPTPAPTANPTPTSSAATKPVETAQVEKPVERPTPAGKNGELTFAEYAQQSEAIEKAVSDDPSLLHRIPGALDLYKKLHGTAAKFKAKGKSEGPNERMRQAQLYGATVDIVQELHTKLFNR